MSISRDGREIYKTNTPGTGDGQGNYRGTYSLGNIGFNASSTDKNGYRQVYTVSVKAKNGTSGTWSYDSFLLYVVLSQVYHAVQYARVAVYQQADPLLQSARFFQAEHWWHYELSQYRPRDGQDYDFIEDAKQYALYRTAEYLYAADHTKYRLRPESLPWFFLAGLYRLGDRGAECAVLTREAEGDAASIHGRMPVTFAPEDAALWLDPDADPAALLAEPPIPALCSAEPDQSAQISLWQALEG